MFEMGKVPVVDIESIEIIQFCQIDYTWRKVQPYESEDTLPINFKLILKTL